MDTVTLRLVLAACAVLWLLGCLGLYQRTRHVAWLAGSTVASCLGSLGLTVLASVLVSGALCLAPLWLGVLVLCGLHLWAAYRQSTQRWPRMGGGRPHRPTMASPLGRQQAPYI
jgi:hypothetical protein